MNVWVSATLANTSNLCIEVRGGTLILCAILGTDVPQKVGLCGYRQGWFQAASEPLSLDLGSHELHFRHSRSISIGHFVPLWLIFVLGFSLLFLCYPLLSCNGHQQPHCQHCSYDLRGSVSGVCSECGSRIQSAKISIIDAKLRLSAHWVLLVYIVIGLFWSISNAEVAVSIPRIWWNNDGLSGLLLRLCGPLAWGFSPFWPLLDGTLAATLAPLFVVATSWVVAYILLLRSRLRSVPLQRHLSIAIGWFCIAPFAIGILLWLSTM